MYTIKIAMRFFSILDTFLKNGIIISNKDIF